MRDRTHLKSMSRRSFDRSIRLQLSTDRGVASDSPILPRSIGEKSARGSTKRRPLRATWTQRVMKSNYNMNCWLSAHQPQQQPRQPPEPNEATTTTRRWCRPGWLYIGQWHRKSRYYLVPLFGRLYPQVKWMSLCVYLSVWACAELMPLHWPRLVKSER